MKISSQLHQWSLQRLDDTLLEQHPRFGVVLKRLGCAPFRAKGHPQGPFILLLRLELVREPRRQILDILGQC